MIKSTLFIAVQCCQCSTMQVKQQKKSSNKWTCAVCNQKQSVRKIYAQGYQAKDIRQFVQSFNMSRKAADDQATLECESSSLRHFVEHLEGSDVDEENKLKRRTDWSEFIEDKEDAHPSYLKPDLNEGVMMFEPEVVTDFPEGKMFKKAKLKGNFGCSSTPSSSVLGDNQTYKTHFFKKNADKKTSKLGTEIEVARKEASDNNLTRNVKRGWQQQEHEEKQKKQVAMTMAKRDVSKWSEYMVEDEKRYNQGKY